MTTKVNENQWNQWSPNLTWVMTSGTPRPLCKILLIRLEVSASRPTPATRT